MTILETGDKIKVTWAPPTFGGSKEIAAYEIVIRPLKTASENSTVRKSLLLFKIKAKGGEKMRRMNRCKPLTPRVADMQSVAFDLLHY